MTALITGPDTTTPVVTRADGVSSTRIQVEKGCLIVAFTIGEPTESDSLTAVVLNGNTLSTANRGCGGEADEASDERNLDDVQHT
jgi:hypothetical protein